MFDYTGWIVRSQAGRDKGTLLYVVAVDREGEALLLADGKRRRTARPKRKKPGHVEAVDRGEFNHPVTQSLKGGEAVSDRALRRALSAFKEEMRLGKR